MRHGRRKEVTKAQFSLDNILTDCFNYGQSFIERKYVIISISLIFSIVRNLNIPNSNIIMRNS